MIYAVHYAGCEHPRFQSCLYEAEKRVKEWNNIPEHEKHMYCEPVVLLKIKLKPIEPKFVHEMFPDEWGTTSILTGYQCD